MQNSLNNLFLQSVYTLGILCIQIIRGASLNSLNEQPSVKIGSVALLLQGIYTETSVISQCLNLITYCNCFVKSQRNVVTVHYGQASSDNMNKSNRLKPPGRRLCMLLYALYKIKKTWDMEAY
jgi:hypothetical protein